MPLDRTRINRRSSIKKARRYSVIDAKKLKNKSLLKIVNRYNIKKKLIRLFNKFGKRAIFTNADLDRAIELFGLSHDDMKELAKRRMVKNYNGMSKDELYYTLIRSEKSLQEDSYLKYLKISTNNDLDERINHIRLLTAKLDNKLCYIERAKIFEELDKLKKKYKVKNADERTRRRVIKKIVKITNDLYNVQKQHTKLQHDQTYFGLRDLKHLFTNDKVDYEAIFVRSALKNRFEEYDYNERVSNSYLS